MGHFSNANNHKEKKNFWRKENLDFLWEISKGIFFSLNETEEGKTFYYYCGHTSKMFCCENSIYHVRKMTRLFLTFSLLSKKKCLNLEKIVFTIQFVFNLLSNCLSYLWFPPASPPLFYVLYAAFLSHHSLFYVAII